MRFCRPTSSRISAHRPLARSTTPNTASSGCKSASSDRLIMRRWLPGAAALVVIASSVARAVAVPPPDVQALERAITADPENLRLAAAYRQQNIRVGDFDRSIRLFEPLAERKGSGPNV